MHLLHPPAAETKRRSIKTSSSANSHPLDGACPTWQRRGPTSEGCQAPAACRGNAPLIAGQAAPGMPRLASPRLSGAARGLPSSTAGQGSPGSRLHPGAEIRGGKGSPQPRAPGAAAAGWAPRSPSRAARGQRPSPAHRKAEAPGSCCRLGAASARGARQPRSSFPDGRRRQGSSCSRRARPRHTPRSGPGLRPPSARGEGGDHAGSRDGRTDERAPAPGAARRGADTDRRGARAATPVPAPGSGRVLQGSGRLHPPHERPREAASGPSPRPAGPGPPRVRPPGQGRAGRARRPRASLAPL